MRKMRIFAVSIIVFLVFPVLAIAEVSSEDLIFGVSFDKGIDANKSLGNPVCQSIGNPKLIKSEGVYLAKGSALIYEADKNFDANEGSLVLLLKPDWSREDGKAHCFLEIPVPSKNFLDGDFVISKGFTDSLAPNYFYYYYSPGHSMVEAGPDLKKGVWTQLIFTWSLESKKMVTYQDGKKLGEGELKLKEQQSTTGRKIYIGCRMGGKYPAEGTDPDYEGSMVRDLPDEGAYWFDGTIKEVKFYNRPLVNEEVKVLAKAAGFESKEEDRFDYGSLMMKVSTSEMTPHVPWIKPLAGGPIRVHFIGPRPLGGREIAELSQRMDIEFTDTLAWQFTGLGTHKDMAGENTDNFARSILIGATEEERSEMLKQALVAEPRPDVIIIASVWFGVLDKEHWDLIRKLVSEGTGLVLANLPQRDWPSSEREDHYGKKISGPPYPWLLQGVPIAFLDYFTTKSTNARKYFYSTYQDSIRDGTIPITDIPKRFGNAYQLGKGRVVILDYKQELKDREYSPGMTPSIHYTMTSTAEYDLLMNIPARAVFWASGRDFPVIFTDSPAHIYELTQDELPTALQLEIENITGEGLNLTAEISLRTMYFEEVSTWKIPVSVAPGKRTLNLTVPSVPGGDNLLYIRLLNSRNEAINWGMFALRIKPAVKFKSIDFASNIVAPGGHFEAKVNLQGVLPDGVIVEARLKDYYGREIAREKVAAKPLIDISIPTSLSLSLSNILDFRLIGPGDVELDRKRVWAFIPRRESLQSYRAIFHGPEFSHLEHYYRNTLKKYIGINETNVAIAGTDNERLEEWAKENIHVSPMLSFFKLEGNKNVCLDKLGYFIYGEDDKQVEGGCVTDPEYMDKARECVIWNVKRALPFKPMYYNLGSECQSYPQACLSKTCITGFQKFAREMYGTIEKANAEWGTVYKSWEEVIIPVATVQEALKQGIYVQWADYHAFRQKLYADVWKMMADVIREIDPGAPTTSDIAADENLVETLKAFDGWMSFGSTIAEDIIGDKWSPYPGGLWGGYLHEITRPEKQWRDGIWELPMVGLPNYFFTSPLNWDAFDPGYAPGLVIKYTKDILDYYAGGLEDQLVKYGTRYRQEGFASYYSPASDRARALIKGTGLTRPENVDSSGRIISATQIKSGEWRKYGIRVLSLNGVLAISSEEVQELEAFVKEGGILLADWHTGMMDEHCKLGWKPELDKIFGIRHLHAPSFDMPGMDGDVEVKQAKFFGQTVSLSLKDIRLDRSVEVTTGEPLAIVLAGKSPFRQEIPFAITHNYGKGKTILFNANIDAGGMKEEGGRIAISKLLEIVLESVGANPTVELERVEESNSSISGVLRLRSLKNGGIVVMPRATDYTKSNPYRLKLKEKGWIYDIREGKSLGQRQEIEGTLVGGNPPIFAILPYEVNSVHLEVPKEGKRGQVGQLKAELLANGGVPKNHVLRFEVWDSERKWIEHYRRNIATDESGKAIYEIPLALSDKQGTWKITVTDVLTGVKAEGELIVK